MVLYILLSVLLLYVLWQTAVERKKTSREMKSFRRELNELSNRMTQRESKRVKRKKMCNEVNRATCRTRESQSTTVQDPSYEEYLKRGGTDDYPTFLYKTTEPRPFP